VVAGSSHSDMLASLSGVYPALQWAENGDVEVADLLQKVASGELDFTVADSSDFNIQRHFYPELRVALDLQISAPIAWAFRNDDGDSLLRRADEYLIEAGRQGMLAQVHDRYYGHTEKFDYVVTGRLSKRPATRTVLTGACWQRSVTRNPTGVRTQSLRRVCAAS